MVPLNGNLRTSVFWWNENKIICLAESTQLTFHECLLCARPQDPGCGPCTREPWGCQVWWAQKWVSMPLPGESGSSNSAVMPRMHHCRQGHEQCAAGAQIRGCQRRWWRGWAWKDEQSSPGRGGRQESQAAGAAPAKTQKVNGQFMEWQVVIQGWWTTAVELWEDQWAVTAGELHLGLQSSGTTLLLHTRGLLVGGDFGKLVLGVEIYSCRESSGIQLPWWSSERHCGWLNSGPRRYLCPNPQNLWMLPNMEKELCRYDYVKDVKMGRLSWIIPVGPQCHHKCPYKRGAKRD